MANPQGSAIWGLVARGTRLSTPATRRAPLHRPPKKLEIDAKIGWRRANQLSTPIPHGNQEPVMKSAPHTVPRFNFSNDPHTQPTPAPQKPEKPTAAFHDDFCP